MFLSSHKRFIKRLLFLLIVYSLIRIGFYLYHLNTYKQFTQDEIFQSFLLGIRFDIAAICLLNIIPLFLSFFPITTTKYLKFERIIFTVLNTTGFIVGLNDYELFLFMGKRFSMDLFAVTGDIIDQLPQLAMFYWYFPLLSIALGVGVYFCDKKFFFIRGENRTPLLNTAASILLVALTFIGIRGGLQHKSINVQSAFVQGKNELGHLVLNSSYHFLRTLKNNRIEKLRFFKNDDEAKNIILNTRDFREGIKNPSSKNVILIILESFSLEYIEKGYTPYLSFLAKEGLFLKRHLANGRRSIEVLPSVLCGLPSLIDEPISKSPFSGNKFVCMPKILKELGFTNYFFHGGARGTMGFESYTLSNGFDRYFSKEEYPGEDFDGTWGIYDGPYLKYVAKNISTMKEPFFAGVFTLSSHQPYAVPKDLKGKFPKGTLEIHESIGYTDFAIEGFFEQVSKEPWFKNTVFLITADHTQKLESKKYSNLIGHYRVPLIIYSPGQKFEARDKVTHHSDIPKTVLDLVGVKTDRMPLLGASIFSNDMGVALNYADGRTYFLVTENLVSTWDKNGTEQSFQIDWESGELTPANSDNKLLKANLQYFINGLINNNLSL